MERSHETFGVYATLVRAFWDKKYIHPAASMPGIPTNDRVVEFLERIVAERQMLVAGILVRDLPSI
ncbi:MAG: hypothetical protein ACR2NI_05845 [Pirellulales bacterium]|jgi:hypothetical protein|tara:strand:- start:477 stop:674 length:198 start_codon:yes stop_codon:yes gene_type:complete